MINDLCEDDALAQASSIVVGVRVRPETSHEKEHSHSIVRTIENMIIFDPSDLHDKRGPLHAARRTQEQRYAFDYVFDEFSTNMEIFEKVC
jgi:hypothetical protein